MQFFPEQTRSRRKCGYEWLRLPEQIRSVDTLSIIRKRAKAYFFRSKSVHSFGFFCNLCTVNRLHNSTYMAGKIKDMSLTKQVIQLEQFDYGKLYIKRRIHEATKEKIIYICNNFYVTEYGTVCSVMTVPIRAIRWYRLQCYAWYRFSATVNSTYAIFLSSSFTVWYCFKKCVW